MSIDLVFELKLCPVNEDTRVSVLSSIFNSDPEFVKATNSFI